MPAPMPTRSPRGTGLAQWATVAALAALAAGCGHLGKFVWVDDFEGASPAPQGPDRGYLISPGDVLNVQVWNQPGMSGRTKVRGDGKISLPFLNDVMAAGLGPSVLAAQLNVRLKDFISNPVVTLTLEETRPLSIPVMGEVAQNGVFSLEPGSGVLQALAAAGGLGIRARDEYIFVLRRTSPEEPPTRIRFTYDALTHARGGAAAFKLSPGDIVVVE